jgi:cellobiose phosphorylase
MKRSAVRKFTAPGESGLGLRTITSRSGLTISLLPNGGLFAIEHRHERGRTRLSLVEGSPLDGGIARLYLRVRAPEAALTMAAGANADLRSGATDDRFVWHGVSRDVAHKVSLWLHPRHPLWLWRMEVVNDGSAAVTCDALLAQDVGLAERGFLMNNESYASQYIDHHITRHPECGPVVLSRQNLAQHGCHPWVAHGCLEGVAGFATDAMQLMGPAYRDSGALDPGLDLPSSRLQHEVACPMIQSEPTTLEPGGRAGWTFFGLYEADHPAASSDADLARIDAARHAASNFKARKVRLGTPVRSLVQDAPPIVARPLAPAEIAARYPDRTHEERVDGELVSFFTPDSPHNRHVVLRAKERMVARRHGAVLRSGDGMLPDEKMLSATCWMHGVFAAQLALGNTTFHKLLSVSRDPYNITRSSGLRILVDHGSGWRLLGVPSAFEIGLSDCRWIYRLQDRTVSVHVVVSGDEPAMHWRVTVDGQPCRFLVFAHLVLGERELDHAGRIKIDLARKRIACRPDPASLWARRYPKAVYLMVTDTPDAIKAIGGDELLHADGRSHGGAHVALRTRATSELSFTVVASLTGPRAAKALAARYERPVNAATMAQSGTRYWAKVTRGLRIAGPGPETAALDTMLPWLAHNAIAHLTVAHGLEQYSGAAWGTRDVCQGPVEFLLALEHDAQVKDILRIVFAQQNHASGDWPQWFMLEPYSEIRDRNSHGDVIVWPLKALCDYVEASNDLAFLDERIAWRRKNGSTTTVRKDSIRSHVDRLLATVRKRFVPGTQLIRYGEGDWNDSLQPADPTMRDWMVSSWTVALLYQQINRYANIASRVGDDGQAHELRELAAGIRGDFNRLLIRGGTVAGYALFDPARKSPELLLHPTDARTGLHYSLLPMTRAIIAGLFTKRQAQHHLRLIREHLLFPDGARLMNKPVRYCGGPEQVFRRAESAAFFGREIGVMYVHAHLRYGEAMAVLGEADALWEALQVASPINVTDRLAHASPRQRNAYFSSSDAAFADRYVADAEWPRVKAGTIPVDGGWRIYSSGPGLYVNLLLTHAFGIRRRFGQRSVAAVLPSSLGGIGVEMNVDGRNVQWRPAAKR